MDIILSHTTALEVLRRWDSFRFVESSSATRRPELPGRMPTAREIEPVLAQVRAHGNCRVFVISRENRDALFFDVLEFMKQQTR